MLYTKMRSQGRPSTRTHSSPFVIFHFVTISISMLHEQDHRRGLRWLADEVSKAETELAWARHKLENG